MTDVFISYASQDLDRVKPLVKALESKGLSVWWDRIIPPGKNFSKVIENAINDARCVVVLWSKISIESDWVLSEASEGMTQKKLVPGLIDNVKIPFEFRRLQAANLANWKGETGHFGFNRLLDVISSIVQSQQDVEGASIPEAGPDGDKLARKLSRPNNKTPVIAEGSQLSGGEENHRFFHQLHIFNKKRVHRLVVFEIISSWGVITAFGISFSPLRRIKCQTLNSELEYHFYFL